MTVLSILRIPDPILKKPSLNVHNLNDEIVLLSESMIETMFANNRCVGIAAPQVGKNVRMVAIDVSLHPKNHKNHGRLVLINPVIVFREGQITGREGCLSVPDYTGNVTRADKITVEALDVNGKSIRFDTEAFESVVVQHEIDHLDGFLFLDKVSSLRTDIFRRKSYVDNVLKKE